ncbi:hypothetical protein CONCODRAFT_73135 [Conidiobolus coronatus NRRL 28638]|uniref:Uncharacterized protein n=1 Tax=Conidiobolus coronatus (strain ATCC 28846 / CBS 209.66 / NRRL 28638) TaxID=796925 RepID=A0A137NX65_CONC2|nr:hypothetical protein CONCODRAFT_73135 [Conidiobolus coronatus NRRL 28638]|eukprot:KXN67234.1 hypothetical protein CONCODRAFT_73135 [Conidiobolus coronatus NRRL 28638]
MKGTPISISEKCRKYEHLGNIKCHHMEMLKRYLKKDKLLTYNKARYQLYNETGLEFSVECIKEYILALREEMGLEYDSFKLPSVYTTVRNEYRRRSKIKLYHIEILKKYLEEDMLITAGKANDQIRKETGLEASNGTVKRYLSALRKIIYLENRNHNSYHNLLQDRDCCKNMGKLKLDHIDILKNYLKEDSSITAKQAWIKLNQDTGLEVGINTVKNYLMVMRKITFGMYISNSSNCTEVEPRSVFSKLVIIKDANSLILDGN